LNNSIRGDVVDPGYIKSMTMYMGPDSGILQRRINLRYAPTTRVGISASLRQAILNNSKLIWCQIRQSARKTADKKDGG
jgi:hypothetical protein